MLPVFISLCITITSYILIGIFYLGTHRWPTAYQKKRVVFVTAHPDDEAMFFGPSIRYFRSIAKDIHLLCLSNGDYDGLGDTREEELQWSSRKLGFKQGNVKVVKNTLLQDHPRDLWDEDEVAAEVTRYFKAVSGDILITFDSYGVSGHVNHRAIARGVTHAVRTGMLPDYTVVYQLESVSLLRKYTSFLDCFMSSKGTVYSIGSLSDIINIQSAMKCHKSQFTWFRKLYVMFSRYMIVNTYHTVSA